MDEHSEAVRSIASDQSRDIQDVQNNALAILMRPKAVSALTFAREWLERCREDLGTEAGRARFRKLSKLWAMHSTYGMMVTIAQARSGMEDSDTVVREIWLELTSQQKQTPLELQAYIMDVTAGIRTPKPRGRPKTFDFLSRDLIIGQCVATVASEFGLQPTKNRVSSGPSACFIVAKALFDMDDVTGIGESAVEKIWARYHAHFISRRLAAF